jgi:hypothetical protein
MWCVHGQQNDCQRAIFKKHWSRGGNALTLKQASEEVNEMYEPWMLFMVTCIGFYFVYSLLKKIEEKLNVLRNISFTFKGDYHSAVHFVWERVSQGELQRTESGVFIFHFLKEGNERINACINEVQPEYVEVTATEKKATSDVELDEEVDVSYLIPLSLFVVKRNA